MWRFRRKHPEIPEAGVDQSWSMFQGEYDGKPLIARANVALKPFLGHPKYSHQVGVAVPFRTPDENGFPQSEEAAEFMDIEDQICAELEVGNESLFAAVITTGGMREFVFYTSNPKGVEVKLKNLKETIHGHTIQGMIRPDEHWDVYRQFV
jgi:uncharacterized protein DUF695